MDKQIPLTKRDLAELVKLLGYLQDHLETVIDSNTIPGGSVSSNPDDARYVLAAQRKWRRAENMVKKLEAGKKVA